jgi:hypothetical protein
VVRSARKLLRAVASLGCSGGSLRPDCNRVGAWSTEALRVLTSRGSHDCADDPEERQKDAEKEQPPMPISERHYAEGDQKHQIQEPAEADSPPHDFLRASFAFRIGPSSLKHGKEDPIRASPSHSAALSVAGTSKSGGRNEVVRFSDPLTGPRFLLEVLAHDLGVDLDVRRDVPRPDPRPVESVAGPRCVPSSA